MSIDKGFLFGFIAGEGSFTVNLQVKERSKFGVHITPIFDLTVDSRDEDYIRKVKEEVGIGNIYESRGCITWRVTTIQDIDTLIRLIDDNAPSEWYLTDKAEKYERWKSIVFDKKELQKTRDGIKELIRRSKKVNDGGGLSTQQWIDRLE